MSPRERCSAPAAFALNDNIDDGRRAAIGRSVYQPREGGERDAGRMGIAGGKRASEPIHKSTPHVGTEGRRRSWRCRRRSSNRLGDVVGVIESGVEGRNDGAGLVPNQQPFGFYVRGPIATFLNDSGWCEGRDLNPYRSYPTGT